MKARICFVRECSTCGSRLHCVPESEQAHPTDGPDNDDADTKHEQRRPSHTTGHDVFDADEFLEMVRQLQAMRPEYKHDAETRAEKIADDDQSTVVNVMMEAAAQYRLRSPRA